VRLEAAGTRVLRAALRGGDLDFDVADAGAVADAVARTSPDAIYHLAGVTRPGGGEGENFCRVNVLGTRNVLAAVARHAPRCRVLVVSSAYAYGARRGPIEETAPLEPRDEYGASKAAAELVTRMFVARGVDAVVARPFNHSGPGQPPDYLLPSLVEQFAAIAAGRREPVLRLGNLDAVRDFSDVRDVVRGYVRALEGAPAGAVLNFGSGRGVPVRELVERVGTAAGVAARIEIEPSRIRPDDPPELVADIGRAARELGWRPEIPLERTIADMLAAAARRP
jgi:GDP-4-dehydro-6-deoxy-D-mannose reductase